MSCFAVKTMLKAISLALSYGVADAIMVGDAAPKVQFVRGFPPTKVSKPSVSVFSFFVFSLHCRILVALLLAQVDFADYVKDKNVKISRFR